MDTTAHATGVNAMLYGHLAMLIAIAATHPNPPALLEAFGKAISILVESHGNDPKMYSDLTSYEETMRSAIRRSISERQP